MTVRAATAALAAALLLAPGLRAEESPAEGAEPSGVATLLADAEAAAEDGVSAEDLATLGERALALAAEAEAPRETIQAVGVALRVSQYRLGPESSVLRSQAIDLLTGWLDARTTGGQLDAQGELSEEAWNDLARSLDTLRRPDAGDVAANRDTVDEYHRLLQRVEANAASDRLRAIVVRTRLENRLLVDRLFGGLSVGERAEIATDVRDGWERWAALPVNDEATYAKAVRWPLRELELLYLGAAAPEIEGVDLHGAPMKLSDYRGRVVLLDFWASWCPPCVAAIPQQRELLARLAGQPFAIVGVSGDVEREDALAAEEREGASWRSFWAYWPGEDGEAAPLKDTWYVRFWPTYYVLDREGTIRYKGSWDEDLGTIEEVVRGLLSPTRPAR